MKGLEILLVFIGLVLFSGCLNLTEDSRDCYTGIVTNIKESTPNNYGKVWFGEFLVAPVINTTGVTVGTIARFCNINTFEGRMVGIYEQVNLRR